LLEVGYERGTRNPDLVERIVRFELLDRGFTSDEIDNMPMADVRLFAMLFPIKRNMELGRRR